jgi:hypothetical protein
MIKSIDATANKILYYDGALYLQAVDGSGRVDIPGAAGLATKQKYPRLCERSGIYYTAWTNAAMTMVLYAEVRGTVAITLDVPVQTGYKHSYPTLAVDSLGNIHMVCTRWQTPAAGIISKAWAAVKSAFGGASGEPAVYYYKPAGGLWQFVGVLPGADAQEYRNIAACNNPDGSVLYSLTAWGGLVLVFGAIPGKQLSLVGSYAKPAKNLNPGQGSIDNSRLTMSVWSGETQTIYTLLYNGAWQAISTVIPSTGYDVMPVMSGKYISWCEKLAVSGSGYIVRLWDGDKISNITLSAEMTLDSKSTFAVMGSVLYVLYSDTDIIKSRIAGGAEPPIPPDPPPGTVTVTYTQAEIAKYEIDYQKLSEALPGVMALYNKILDTTT